MSDAGRDLISAINSLATEIERGIFVAQGISAPPSATSRKTVRAHAALPAGDRPLRAGGSIGVPRGEISAAMRRLEGMLAREQRLGKSPRVCGVQ
jgi:hypothetical protein